MDKDVEQCAKALESGGFERKKAAEPIEGVLGGSEYMGGGSCASMEGSSKRRSEGNAGWSEKPWAWVGVECLEGDAGGAAHVHESSRGMDKLPIESCNKSSRGS